jgi:hypothetical protein
VLPFAVALLLREDGNDVAGYSLLAVVAGFLLLPLRIRLSVGPEGVVVQNLLLRHRLRWEDIDAVVVEPFRVDIFWYFTARPTILWFQTERTPFAHAVATWGLSQPARRRLVTALNAAADHHGFRWTGGENFSEGWERGDLLVRDRPVVEDEWAERMRLEAGDEVECVACGRRGPPSAMEPFGEEGDTLGWYCVDEGGCAARQAARSAQPTE